jgi:malate dehydrogenase (oxaloacetate-decarboxylating)(NADP+)
MGITPRVAMLSFSNFGSVRDPSAEKMAEAARLLREREPSIVVDGEMQADSALNPEILGHDYPFSLLKEEANVLIFPNLSAGNIAYKMMHVLGGATAIGPILLGMRRPVHVLERGADVQDIVNMSAVAVVDAQERMRHSEPLFAAIPATPAYAKST